MIKKMRLDNKKIISKQKDWKIQQSARKHK